MTRKTLDKAIALMAFTGIVLGIVCYLAEARLPITLGVSASTFLAFIYLDGRQKSKI